MATSLENIVEASVGRTRYARLSYASHIVIPKMLQELLMYYEPPEIILKDCIAISRKFTSTEWEQIKNAKLKGYDDFGISFIYKIIRNLEEKNLISNVKYQVRPSNGWDNPKDPGETDTTVGDDLERCRRLLNAIIHRGNSNVTDTELEGSFKIFKDIARRLEKMLGKRHNEFLSQLELLEKCCMDEQTEMKYLEEVKEYNERIRQLEEQLKHISISNQAEDSLSSEIVYKRNIDTENICEVHQLNKQLGEITVEEHEQGSSNNVFNRTTLEELEKQNLILDNERLKEETKRLILAQENLKLEQEVLLLKKHVLVCKLKIKNPDFVT